MIFNLFTAYTSVCFHLAHRAFQHATSLFFPQPHHGHGWLSPCPCSSRAEAAGQNLLHFGVNSHHGLGLTLPAVRLERKHLVFHPHVGWSLPFISQPRAISHLSAKQAFLRAGENWEEEEEELTALRPNSPCCSASCLLLV